MIGMFSLPKYLKYVTFCQKILRNERKPFLFTVEEISARFIEHDNSNVHQEF